MVTLSNKSNQKQEKISDGFDPDEYEYCNAIHGEKPQGYGKERIISLIEGELKLLENDISPKKGARRVVNILELSDGSIEIYFRLRIGSRPVRINDQTFIHVKSNVIKNYSGKNNKEKSITAICRMIETIKSGKWDKYIEQAERSMMDTITKAQEARRK